MGVLTNCTITSEEVVGETNFPSTTLVISPNEGYTIAAQAVSIQDVSYATNSNSLVYTDGSTVVFPRVSNAVGSIVTNVTLSDVGGKVNVLVNIADAYTITADTPLPIDITVTATAITDYGLVRPAIIESAEYQLEETTVTITNNNSATDNIVLVEGVSDENTHYLNAEVPLDTWKKIGEVTITTDIGNSGYTFNYPPFLSSNGSEVSLSKFDLIQTSITEDPDTGQITVYGFDLMFKNTGTTGFVWPLVPVGTVDPFIGDPYWKWNAITDPDITAVLNIKVQIMDLPDYDYVIDGVDLGGGTEDVTSGTDVIPSGGAGTYNGVEYSEEPFDIVFSGSNGAEVTIEVTEVSGGTNVTTEATGSNSSTVYTMSDLGFVNIPLGFALSTTTKEFDVTITGAGTTAILSQVKKTSVGSHTSYSTEGSSSATNRYIQLGSANVDVIIEDGGDGWSRNGGDGSITKSGLPLSDTSGKDTFTFTMNYTGNIQKKPSAPTVFDTINNEGVVVTVKNLVLTTSTVTGTITGDIFYERMGYKTKTFTLDFNDWFELDS
jgi:hypothetical protein